VEILQQSLLEFLIRVKSSVEPYRKAEKVEEII
jgi:hypothetical protein